MNAWFGSAEEQRSHWAPTLWNQKREARKLPYAELRRHAGVSIDNRCKCRTCFCCACVAVLRERATDPTLRNHRRNDRD